MNAEYYALVPYDIKPRIAWGVGVSVKDAILDGNSRGFRKDQTSGVFRITPESYEAIKAGDQTKVIFFEYPVD